MLPFSEQKFILFDVQTTGTSPETSEIIEAGWGLYQASADPLTVDWQVRLIALRETVSLPRRIQKLTGLVSSSWQDEPTISYAELLSELNNFLREHDALPILVHYARFKRPFLLKAITDGPGFWADSRWHSFQERVACTYELSKRVLPHLKSFSLRAVAGYVGHSLGDKKRSRDHLIATAFIWKYMVEEGSQASSSPPTLPLQDPGIRQKRLALPEAPGVYYFMDQAQRILYVGKASSLKHRLNSYFRGQKTKGSRLNEMLTRAVDFQYQVVTSELEALFLESDEIKRLDPPYNRLLKTDERCVQSFRLNDALTAPLPWGYQPWGPCLSLWNFQWLASISGYSIKPEAQPARSWVDRFFTPELLAAGKGQIFGKGEPTAETWRSWARDLWEAARTAEEKDEEEEKDESGDEDPITDEPTEATPEQAAAFIQHTTLHAMRQLHRARWRLRLMECQITWQFRDKVPASFRLMMRSGLSFMEESDQDPQAPANWQKTRIERLRAMDLPMHDRLSILYSELRKGLRRGDQIRICWRPGLVLTQDELRNHLF